MARPEGITDEQWDAILEAKAIARARESLHERIRAEGFETSAWDPEPGETCIRRKTKKPRRRYVIEPCGAPAFIGLRLQTPENPAGIDIPLCRPCLVAELRNLLGYLD
jgi:hypothetical protein